MGQNTLIAGIELYGFGTPHTSDGWKHHTQLLASGALAIDCSYLVYEALYNSGYGAVLPASVGDFYTQTLWDDYATAATDTTKFSRFTPTEAASFLQPGDILLLTNTATGIKHTGIFSQYEPGTGYPMFYEVGDSRGTTLAKVDQGWGYTLYAN